MSRVYVDSGVLMLAATAREPEIAERALRELDRQGVVFLFSSLVELETLPQPTHNRRDLEKQFYLDFFAESERVECSETEQQEALRLMCAKNGLKCIDALHVACAVGANATELITAEGVSTSLTTLDVAALGLEIRSLRVAA